MVLNRQLDIERTDVAISKKESEDRTAELNNKEKSLDRVRGALETKEKALEITQLRLEKKLRENGMEKELEALKKELREL